MYSSESQKAHPTAEFIDWTQNSLPTDITYNSIILFTNITIHETVPFVKLYIATTAHQKSYFPRTINDWNMLPVHLIEITDNDTFKIELQSLL